MFLTCVVGGGEDALPPDERSDATRKAIRHNEGQIAKFLEFRDTVMKGSSGGFFNVGSDRKKGESGVPMSGKGHVTYLHPKNDEFRLAVMPLIYAVQFDVGYEPARVLEEDPAALRRWRAGETPEDKDMLIRFKWLVRLLALRLERRHPGLRVCFHVNPEDADVPNYGKELAV